MSLDALKAGGLLLFAALVQVSIASTIGVADGHPDVVLVVLIGISLLRGPLFGAVAGFWAGLALDVVTLEPLGLTSLLLTLVGYFAGRLGDVTTKSSAHPSLVAVALGTIGFAIGSAVLHFMLDSTLSAGHFFIGVLLPTLALNLLLAYPIYGLCRRIFRAERPAHSEVSPAV
jgi:rod shape-determining protein MreD